MVGTCLGQMRLDRNWSTQHFEKTTFVAYKYILSDTHCFQKDP